MSFYKNLIDEYDGAISNNSIALIKSISRSATHRRLYLFGRNELSSCLSDNFRIDGFIDDYAAGSIWKDKPVLSLDDVAANDIVVNCVNNSRPATAYKKIQKSGIETILSYSDFCRVFPNIIPLPQFVNQTRIDILENHMEWDNIFNILSDAESKKVLQDVIKFRLTGDFEALNAYTYRPEEQYFEEFLGIGSEIFVDAGGFDGYTTELFCLKYPDYRQIYLFEPAKNNMALAKSRLKNLKKIDFIEKGVSDTSGVLSFNSSLGSANSVSEEGDTNIEVTTIDSYIREKVTFIKMDLEGWELKALDGAADHITNNHPKLAVAVYHNAADTWETYRKVISYWPNYKVYLRHYTEGWTETIMYFVPQ